jgi:hypothetical protein
MHIDRTRPCGWLHIILRLISTQAYSLYDRGIISRVGRIFLRIIRIWIDESDVVSFSFILIVVAVYSI